MTATYIVPWCASCGCDSHGPYDGPVIDLNPICAQPGCFEEVSGLRKFCDTHRRERDLASRRAASSRYYHRTRNARPKPGDLPRPFPFDAIRACLPADLRDAEKGVTENGWWGHLADVLQARHPEVALHAARQRVGRLRGAYLDAYEADEWAITLGVHPSAIWSNWYAMTEEPVC